MVKFISLFFNMYVNSPKHLRDVCEATGLPAHAHVLIDTYFANRPPERVQNIYKSCGALCSQYWFHELAYIFGATLECSEQFISLPHMHYYIDKYQGHSTSIKLQNMDQQDRKDILRAFTTQLGMHWTLFPYSISDFEK